MKIALFVTCLGDVFTPRAAIAAVKLLERLGHEVTFPEAQTCCGQPMFNNGFEDEARTLARGMLDVFESAEVVVTPSGSCAAMLREHYVHLFEHGSVDAQRAKLLAARTFELVEFLVLQKLDLKALGATWSGGVTYHYSCHLRGIGVTDEAVRLLKQIDGVTHTPLERAEQCCGFGGTFAVSYPAISGQMAMDKVGCIRATGCGTVVSNDTGCTMNLEGACRRAGVAVQFLSTAEVIAESLGLLPVSP